MILTINVDKYLKERKVVAPVSSPQIYFGKSTTFHPQGLYSEDIFGVEGSVERRTNISYINLHSRIIHPVIYDILRKRIFRKIDDLISGNKFFSIDENGYLVEDEFGEISGMTAFYENIDKIRFTEGEDSEGDRNKIIEMIYANIKAKKFFMDKLIVISPDYRPIHIFEETGEVKIDELTKLYQKIIGSTSQIGSVSGSIYDVLVYRLQLLVRDLYELVKVKVSKKSGMIRHLMLGKRVDYSARGVITPEPNLTIGYVGIPLRFACLLFEPYLIHAILFSKDANRFISKDFHRASKAFLAKEEAI
jgi:DNA-directed RNA polymerase beta' subunit